jgi:hypothetical protein
MATGIEALQGAPSGEMELARVERELAALWAAAPENRGEEPAVLRSCALNLLILGSSPDDLERARPVAARTTLAHPSRILLLAPAVRGQSDDPSVPQPPTPDPGDSIGARISAFCHRLGGGGGRHVCCEEITIVARGAAAERLPEAALPLLLPDLPVFLWIPGESSPGAGAKGPRNDDSAGLTLLRRFSHRLADLADVVIWSERETGDHLVTSSIRPRPPSIVDLDWMRILPWRELTAQLFDAHDRRPLLERLERVEVTVADPPKGRPGAGWLWIGWLASRLGWEAKDEASGPSPANDGTSDRKTERRLKRDGGAVTARVLTGEPGNVPPGEVLAVRLFVRGSSEPLVLERHSAPDPAELWISHGRARCVDLGIRDEAALLGEALGASGRDPCYASAWDMAARLWMGS